MDVSSLSEGRNTNVYELLDAIDQFQKEVITYGRY